MQATVGETRCGCSYDKTSVTVHYVRLDDKKYHGLITECDKCGSSWGDDDGFQVDALLESIRWASVRMRNAIIAIASDKDLQELGL